LVTLSQHFIEPEAAALGEVVDDEVWAPAIPTPPASIAAAAISPILVIDMRHILLLQMSPASARRDVLQQEPGGTVPLVRSSCPFTVARPLASLAGQRAVAFSALPARADRTC